VLHGYRVAQEDAVANLTITVDAESLKKARIRAFQEGTSVNALLIQFASEKLPNAPDPMRARGNLSFSPVWFA
jgi:hypothetical protein